MSWKATLFVQAWILYVRLACYVTSLSILCKFLHLCRHHCGIHLSSFSCSNLWPLVALMLKLSFLTAQNALCSSFMGKWHDLPNTNGDILIGILNIVWYTHSTSSNLTTQSLQLKLTIFSRIYLTFLLEIFAWPFIYEWYTNATLCLTL